MGMKVKYHIWKQTRIEEAQTALALWADHSALFKSLLLQFACLWPDKTNKHYMEGKKMFSHSNI